MSERSDHVRASRRGLLGSVAASVVGLAGCGGRTDDSTTQASGEDTRSPSETQSSGDETLSPSDTQSPTEGVVTDQTATPTPRPTVTPGEVTIPEVTDGPLRERVARIGEAIRPAVGLLASRRLPIRAAGVFLDRSVVVTTSSVLDELGDRSVPDVETIDGRSHETTLLGRTESTAEDDLAALRVETEGATIPTGSAADLSTGDVVVHVGHLKRAEDWAIQFGRVRGWTDDGERFTSSVPFPIPGGPVVTLDGALVGVTTRRFGTDPPPTETPPPTERPTVYTDEARHEPLSDVRALVDEWTG